MSDLISRQAAIDAICEHGTDLERRGITVLAVVNHKQVTVDLLEKLPSEERKGKWIEKEVHDGKIIDEWQSACCSICGKYHTTPYMYYFNRFNFCPNCGADMRGEEDAEAD